MRLALALLAVSALAQDTRVVLLGTGNPNPEPARSGPAVAVITGDHVYVVDAGPGVVRRAAQAGVRMEQLTRLFLTHLHSDHTAGLPDFLFTPAVTGRLTPVFVYGPPGTRSMVNHLMAAYKEDLDIRLRGLEPAVPRAYDVIAQEPKLGEVYRDGHIRVIAFAVPHGQWKHAWGYRFEAKDKTIVISGDTTYSDALIRAAAGCDILVHEVYSEKGWSQRTPEWRKYHAAYHTSAPALGRVAAKVNPRKLVLYHQLPMGQPPAQVLAEITGQFTGEVIYGNDLDVIR